MIIRIWIFWLAAACLAAVSAAAQPRNLDASVTLDGIPDVAPEARDRLSDYLQARPASVLGFSPQGQLLIRSRFGDTQQLHLVAQPEGARRQLTFGRNPVAFAAFSPDPQRRALVYLQDRDGDANFQLYYQRLDEPAVSMQNIAGSENSTPLWSSSGHEIAFTSTVNNGQSHDIMIVDPGSGALAHLGVAGDGADWRALDWASDDHLLLALKTVSRLESHLYLVDLVSGQRRELDPSTMPVSIKDARLARDGQAVYYISDAYGEFSQLRYINVFTGQKAAMSDQVRVDVGELALSRDGRYLAYTSNEGGSDRLNLVDIASHQDLTPPRLPLAGLIHGLHFDADAKRLAFSLAATTQPDDAYVLDIATNSVTAWTHSEAGPVDSSRFVAPKLVQVPTFDHDSMREREIPTYVYAPASNGRHPVLINLGAGPEQQFRPEFAPWIQYLVNDQGFAVIAPNLRGSPGYGKSYATAGMGLGSEDAVKDIGALLVWVRTQRDLDAQRVFVSGRGYGATLALATLVNYPDRVRGGVALCGISDMVGWLGSADAGVQARRRAQFGDERDLQVRAALRRLSPLTNVERITRPMLIAHGKNDREVAIEQSDELVAALRSHNVPAWYLVANDQGHDFSENPAFAAFLRIFAQFLATY